MESKPDEASSEVKRKDDGAATEVEDLFTAESGEAHRRGEAEVWKTSSLSRN